MAKQVKQRATRADVAQEAGTSVAVVSYVVNNGPRPVAPATRERVLAAIKKTGYRPNNVARALASGTTKTYGLVVPNIDNGLLPLSHMNCNRKRWPTIWSCCWAMPVTIANASCS